MLKRFTVKQLFQIDPEFKALLLGGCFLTSARVGQYSNEEVTCAYAGKTRKHIKKSFSCFDAPMALPRRDSL